MKKTELGQVMLEAHDKPNLMLLSQNAEIIESALFEVADKVGMNTELVSVSLSHYIGNIYLSNLVDKKGTNHIVTSSVDSVTNEIKANIKKDLGEDIFALMSITALENVVRMFKQTVDTMLKSSVYVGKEEPTVAYPIWVKV